MLDHLELDALKGYISKVHYKLLYNHLVISCLIWVLLSGILKSFHAMII